MMFSKTWFTIPKPGATITFNCSQCTAFLPGVLLDRGLTAVDYNVTIRIQYGYYASTDALIEEMNSAIGQALSFPTFPIVDVNGKQSRTKLDRDMWPVFKHNNTKRKFNVVLQPGISLTFDSFLAQVLGLRNNYVIQNRTSTERTLGGSMPTDIHAGIHNLFVYCDVLENVPVGDTLAPLLRVVDATGKHGENVNITFNPARYVPVSKHRFDSIQIDIRSDIGEPVPFESGRLSTTLHFRRVAEGLFE